MGMGNHGHQHNSTASSDTTVATIENRLMIVFELATPCIVSPAGAVAALSAAMESGVRKPFLGSYFGQSAFRNLPFLLMTFPSTSTMPPLRRSQTMSQWTALWFLPPLSG